MLTRNLRVCACTLHYMPLPDVGAHRSEAVSLLLATLKSLPPGDAKSIPLVARTLRLVSPMELVALLQQANFVVTHTLDRRVGTEITLRRGFQLFLTLKWI